jgi:hypothetical protein
MSNYLREGQVNLPPPRFRTIFLLNGFGQGFQGTTNRCEEDERPAFVGEE